MRILSVHHKGGVGKTTTAVHVTGILLEQGAQVLLVDGDTQADSYTFFSKGEPPKRPGDAFDAYDGRLRVVSLKPDEPLDSVVRGASRRQHVIVDIATDMSQISKMLVAVEPDLVLVGVRKYDRGSYVHLDDVLGQVERARALGVSPRVTVVPIGVTADEFLDDVATSPNAFHVADAIEWSPEVAGEALFGDHRYIWEYDGHEHLRDAYQALLDNR